MQLYSLSLEAGKAITQAVYGNFSGVARSHEFVVARGKVLELLKPDDSGEIESICELQVFGKIRSLAALRLTGDTRDYIVVGSDSGRLTVLKYDVEKLEFTQVHCETFGKSGSRRIVPGQYLATDPQGRAIMISAVEKQKLVYVTNRDTTNKLTISSPLEAHKSNTIVFSIVGLDVGFDNPMFASLEVNYENEDKEKSVVLYELDLGLNHVVRRWSETVLATANHLVAVPGGGDGPSGCIVCSEDTIQYIKEDHPKVTVLYPRRQTTCNSTIIVCSAVHRQKNLFFIMLQSEKGDLFKVTIDYENDTVKTLNVEYFDTIPTGNALCITKRGLLFLAAEFGDHKLYQFSDERQVSYSIKATSGSEEVLTFIPRALCQLKLIDTMHSMAPCLGLKVANLCAEESPQIYTLCGRGSRSTLRILRHGLATTNVAMTQLPGNPNAVWTVKNAHGDEFDKYIIVSFLNATLVLSVGEKVEQVTDSGFDTMVQTMGVSLLFDDTIVQVHKNGLRHLKKEGKEDWSPGSKTVQKAAVNNRQVAVALSGGEVAYFEMNPAGSLVELARTNIGVEVTCLDLAQVPKGRVRSSLLAVGCYDKTVRMYSLDPNNRLKELALQGLPDQAETLCFALFSASPTLCIGLSNGILVRTLVDETNGQLKDTRTQFLGSRPVKCYRLTVYEQPAVIALSSRPWLCYTYQNRVKVTPLSYDPLSHASNFSNEQCDGIVAVAKNTLRIFTIENLGQTFNVKTVKLDHTPRRMVLHPQLKNAMVIVEGDHNAPSKKERLQTIEQNNKLRAELYGETEPLHEPDTKVEDEDEEDEGSRLSFDQIGYTKAGARDSSKWTSVIRVIDPNEGNLIHLVELEEDEMAVSVAVVVFKDRSGEPFLIVGTTKSMQFHPRKVKTGKLKAYRFMPDGTLNMLHSTDVPDIPLAICGSPDGRLIVGVGKCLRMYELGMKHLLLKYEYRGLATMATYIYTKSDRIYVGDAHESCRIYKYSIASNKISFFADDITPRLSTAGEVLDYDTVAGADKFGNLYVLRVPSELSETIDVGLNNKLWDQSSMASAPNKLQQLAQFYVGETVTSIQKAALVPGRAEVLVYCTVNGAIGVLAPFVSKEDADFFNHLEMHLRNTMTEMVGREHLSFRSAFIPVKSVVDGDLCEQYLTLPSQKQKEIAEELDSTPSETIKKIEELYIRLI